MIRDTQTERTRDFFDAIAGDWTCRYQRSPDYAERLGRFLNAVQAKVSPQGEILDFGCGAGDITLHLSRHGYLMTGYDVSEAMIAAAQRADLDRRVKWMSPVAGKEHRLPFAGLAFDAVIASSVFEYLADIDIVLLRLASVLGPGGWLFATVPDIRRSLGWKSALLRWAAQQPIVCTLLGRSPWREGATYQRLSINRFVPEAWLAKLRAAGLEPEVVPAPCSSLMLLAARKPLL